MLKEKKKRIPNFSACRVVTNSLISYIKWSIFCTMWVITIISTNISAKIELKIKEMNHERE